MQIFLGETDESDSKKTKGSPYFVQELAYLLAHLEEKIPFVQLGEEVCVISERMEILCTLLIDKQTVLIILRFLTTHIF